MNCVVFLKIYRNKKDVSIELEKQIVKKNQRSFKVIIFIAYSVLSNSV